MSNVLIGIIGVILFIGLALAGALYLGPQFKSSYRSAATMQLVTSMEQSAAAARLQLLQTGSVPVNTTTADLQAAGYLKTAVLVPRAFPTSDPAAMYTVKDPANIAAASGEGSILMGRLEFEANGTYCLEINQKYGSSSVPNFLGGVDDIRVVTTDLPQQGGCFRAGNPTATPQSYLINPWRYVWIRLR